MAFVRSSRVLLLLILVVLGASVIGWYAWWTVSPPADGVAPERSDQAVFTITPARVERGRDPFHERMEPRSPATVEETQMGSTELAGRVVSEDQGDGIAGAELTLARVGTTTSTVTSADGTFTLGGLAPGVYQVASVTADGFLPFAPPWGHSPLSFTATAGRRLSGIVVTLRPARRYIARVLEPGGRPAAAAAVRLFIPAELQAPLAPCPPSMSATPRARSRLSHRMERSSKLGNLPLLRPAYASTRASRAPGGSPSRSGHPPRRRRLSPSRGRWSTRAAPRFPARS